MSIQVLRDLDHLRLSGVVLSIGNFDGVHRGHQAIIGAARRRAQAAGTQVVAMTFEPHPATVLAPERVPEILTPLHEKIRCLEAAGADIALVVESRPMFFDCPAKAFIQDIVVERFHPVAMVEGASFRFGRHRQGDMDMLQHLGTVHGFEVEIVAPIRVDLGGHPDTVISSSLIRHLLSSGTVDRAAICLGRPYALFGTVEAGAARGRTLGFATANLALTTPQLTPPEGVYAGRASVEGEVRPAAISIGRTPTFGGDQQLIEAHLLDFTGDLYGRDLRLEFLSWLRPQQKFASAVELQRQVQADIGQTRKLFEAAG